MLKMRASDLAMRMATEAVQLHGGYGYMQGLPRRAPDARRQDHPDLGRHQPGPPPADRPELRREMSRAIKTVAVCGGRRHHGRRHRHRRGARGLHHHLLRRRACMRWTAPRSQTDGFFAKSVERGKLSAADKDAVMSQLGAHDLARRLRRMRPGHRGGVRGPGGQARAARQAGQDLPAAARSSRPTPRPCRSPRSPAARGRDDRVVGMHFCLPAQLMKLVEMSPGLAT